MKKESMGMQQVIRMKGGVGEESHARNSIPQAGYYPLCFVCVFSP